jgi:hypothetical protein
MSTQYRVFRADDVGADRADARPCCPGGTAYHPCPQLSRCNHSRHVPFTNAFVMNNEHFLRLAKQLSHVHLVSWTYRAAPPRTWGIAGRCSRHWAQALVAAPPRTPPSLLPPLLLSPRALSLSLMPMASTLCCHELCSHFSHHSSLSPFVPLTIHPSHHSSLSPFQLPQWLHQNSLEEHA